MHSMMQSDGDCDSDLALQAVVEMWPQLDDATKRRILETASRRASIAEHRCLLLTADHSVNYTRRYEHIFR